MKKISFVLLLHCIVFSSLGQVNPMNSSQIYLEIQKLQELKSVLYIAAHPDDENTRLITHFSKHQKARTAYLSLTRGDGGQNLIGTEKGEYLGLLRTNELLEARKIDGGEQYFTRANDFGYSKTTEETFTKWDKKTVLGDMVWAIRRFKPDVLITRFPPDNYAGHGHHSASAVLAEEAFDLSGDKNAFPEQLAFVSVWQPKRLYFNVSTWWDKDLPKKYEENPAEYVTVDIGKYDQVLGKSYSEIAAESRTMHKSQGFGSAKTKGESLDYLKYVKGEKAINNDIFSGISTSWTTVSYNKAIDEAINKIISNYSLQNPSKSLGDLLKLHTQISALTDNRWKETKLKSLENIILSCIGFFCEITADDYKFTANDSINLNIYCINRSEAKVKIGNIEIMGKQYPFSAELKNNIAFLKSEKTTITQFNSTQHYWLESPFENMYTVVDQKIIGNPLNEYCIEGKVELLVEGKSINISLPVKYKRTDPVKGEVYKPVIVLPEVTVSVSKPIHIFYPNKKQLIKVQVLSHKNKASGKLKVELPNGWIADKTELEYSIAQKNNLHEFSIYVTPTKTAQNGELKILTDVSKVAKNIKFIEYDHIETQVILSECTSKLIMMSVVNEPKKVGYIVGAGDEIPLALEQLGYSVTTLDEQSIFQIDLSNFDVIITGVRAYNTNKYLEQAHPKLMDFVKNGGKLIVQYCTNSGLVIKNLGPYPMEIGRERITDEFAKPTLLVNEHPIFNTPYKIENSDFENWVQERGLYFAKNLDSNYTPLISWNDPNEEVLNGGLVVANYGKGQFIYTGISFFRQLPAGVSGAYKLFTNIVEYGK